MVMAWKLVALQSYAFNEVILRDAYLITFYGNEKVNSHARSVGARFPWCPVRTMHRPLAYYSPMD
jgi:hypothetical protein